MELSFDKNTGEREVTFDTTEELGAVYYASQYARYEQRTTGKVLAYLPYFAIRAAYRIQGARSKIRRLNHIEDLSGRVLIGHYQLGHNAELSLNPKDTEAALDALGAYSVALTSQVADDKESRLPVTRSTEAHLELTTALSHQALEASVKHFSAAV